MKSEKDVKIMYWAAMDIYSEISLKSNRSDYRSQVRGMIIAYENVLEIEPKTF